MFSHLHISKYVTYQHEKLFDIDGKLVYLKLVELKLNTVMKPRLVQFNQLHEFMLKISKLARI